MDGLPNLAEFHLGTDPTAPFNPLNFSTITNGTRLSGFVQLPLIGISPFISPTAINLIVNSNAAANSTLMQGPDGVWFINWDTSFLTNGRYSISTAFQFNPGTSSNAVYGNEKSIEIANTIIFDQLTTKFADFLLIDLKLAMSSASYSVQLFDEDGSALVSGSGSVTNGKIQLFWDLTDGNGNQLSFGNIQARIALNAGGTNFPPEEKWFIKDAGIFNRTGFVIAWGWDYYASSYNNYHNDMMLNGVINILGNPFDFSSYNLAPIGNVANGGSFRFNTATDKKILLSALEQNSYFFWLGHGSYITIAGNTKIANISPSEVSELLENRSYSSTKKHPRQDKHPYKLAVLNGCETYGPLWAGAFGIDFSDATSTNSILDYQFTGRVPRAFVGWTKENLVPNGADIGGLVHGQFGEALAELWSNWMAGAPLDICLDAFSDSAMSDGFDGQDSYRISGCYDLRRSD